MSGIAKVAVFAFVAGLAASAQAASDDWARVGEALGKPGTEMPGGVYRVGLAAYRPQGDARRGSS